MNPKFLEEFENVLGGKMRDPTPEEQEALDNYIKSIYKPTGLNFFDLMDEDNDDEKENA